MINLCCGQSLHIYTRSMIYLFVACANILISLDFWWVVHYICCYTSVQDLKSSFDWNIKMNLWTIWIFGTILLASTVVAKLGSSRVKQNEHESDKEVSMQILIVKKILQFNVLNPFFRCRIRMGQQNLKGWNLESDTCGWKS